jgi:hypothetical protein
MLGSTGVNAIELKIASVMVSSVVVSSEPKEAVISAEPMATPLARPLSFTVATWVLAEDQVTDAVTSGDVPSEYVPVAINCLVKPLAMLGLAGVMARELSVASVTVSVVVADCTSDELIDAVIAAEPGITPMARPLPLIVAIAESSDDQVAELEISDEVPSE